MSRVKTAAELNSKPSLCFIASSLLWAPLGSHCSSDRPSHEIRRRSQHSQHYLPALKHFSLGGALLVVAETLAFRELFSSRVLFALKTTHLALGLPTRDSQRWLCGGVLPVPAKSAYPNPLLLHQSRPSSPLECGERRLRSASVTPLGRVGVARMLV